MNNKIFTESYVKKTSGNMEEKYGNDECLQTEIHKKKKVKEYEK